MFRKLKVALLFALVAAPAEGLQLSSGGEGEQGKGERPRPGLSEASTGSPASPQPVSASSPASTPSTPGSDSSQPHDNGHVTPSLLHSALSRVLLAIEDVSPEQRWMMQHPPRDLLYRGRSSRMFESEEKDAQEAIDAMYDEADWTAPEKETVSIYEQADWTLGASEEADLAAEDAIASADLERRTQELNDQERPILELNERWRREQTEKIALERALAEAEAEFRRFDEERQREAVARNLQEFYSA